MVLEENKEKIKLLKNVSIFSTLKNSELEVVAQYSNYEEFLSGCEIFKEGNTAEELYIIKEGEVVIRKLLEANKEIDLARFIDGECFGEILQEMQGL